MHILIKIRVKKAMMSRRTFGFAFPFKVNQIQINGRIRTLHIVILANKSWFSRVFRTSMQISSNFSSTFSPDKTAGNVEIAAGIRVHRFKCFGKRPGLKFQYIFAI